MPVASDAITDFHAPIEAVLLLLRRDPDGIAVLRKLGALVDPEPIGDYLRRLWKYRNLTRLFLVEFGSVEALLLQRLEARLARWVPEEAELGHAILYCADGDQIEPVDNACLPGAKIIFDRGCAVLESADGAGHWPIAGIGVPAAAEDAAEAAPAAAPPSSWRGAVRDIRSDFLAWLEQYLTEHGCRPGFIARLDKLDELARKLPHWQEQQQGPARSTKIGWDKILRAEFEAAQGKIDLTRPKSV
ncbi:MAG TPA: hypothetical protein VGF39_17880 [Stellaceae bacterium]|jgi:hypothetical protein